MTRRKWHIAGSVAAALSLLCVLCVVYTSTANHMIDAYMADRMDHYPEADVSLCDVDLWIPPLFEDPPVFVFTYRSDKYPNDHWWAVLSLCGTDQGCGLTVDHIPNILHPIVR